MERHLSILTNRVLSFHKALFEYGGKEQTKGKDQEDGTPRTLGSVRTGDPKNQDEENQESQGKNEEIK
jgi:hypothetical protein